MPGIGFKVADGYVEIHADYNRGELQRAAQQAADDNDRAFNKERERNAKDSSTRDTNRRIGKQANEDFVRGVREQAQRNKESPFIRVEDVRRDASKLGRVHVQEFGKEVEKEVDRRRGLFRRIGMRMGTRIKEGLASRESVGNIAGAFFTRFIELVSFGQADVGMSRLGGPWAKRFAALGATLGATLAAALVVQVGNAVTALLPVALGGALLAVPIADLIFRNISLEKGKLSFEKTAIGKALKGFVRGAQKLADQLGKVFAPAMQAGLESAARLFEAIEKPLSRAVKAITPGALAMWNGLLGAVVSFGKAMGPALKGINAGLKQWGVELPKIGKAIGEAFASILKNPALVRNAVKGLSSLIQGIVKVAVGLVVFLTYALGAWRNLWRLADVGWRIFSKWIGLPGILSRIWRALLPLRKALSDAWEAFKKFATASNDKQALQRFKTLIDKIKKVWDALKPILKKALSEAWDRLKAYWNAHVKPWWENTAKPWLVHKLKEIAKAAFKALVDEAIKWLKSLPGKAKEQLNKLITKIKERLQKAKDDAVQKAKDLVNKVVDWLKRLPGKAATAVSTLWSKMRSKFSDAVSNAKQKAKDLVDGFIKKLKELPGKAADEARKAKDKIKGVFSGAASWLVSAGKDIARGLRDGISAGLSWVTDAAKKLAAAAKNAAKSALGIKSPSTVFAEEVGKPAAQGIAVGLRESFPQEMKMLPGMLPNLGKARAHASPTGQAQGAAFNPTINLYMQPGFYSDNAAAKRALTKDVFLALEQYRKDYIDR